MSQYVISKLLAFAINEQDQVNMKQYETSPYWKIMANITIRYMWVIEKCVIEKVALSLSVKEVRKGVGAHPSNCQLNWFKQMKTFGDTFLR